MNLLSWTSSMISLGSSSPLEPSSIEWSGFVLKSSGPIRQDISEGWHPIDSQLTVRFFGWILCLEVCYPGFVHFSVSAHVVETKVALTIYGNFSLIRHLDAWPMSRSKNQKTCQTTWNIEKSEVSEEVYFWYICGASKGNWKQSPGISSYTPSLHFLGPTLPYILFHVVK